MKHKIEYLKLNKLTGYATNSRTHSDEQIDQIAASITEFGFTNPILIDENNVIIAGHGRLEAAKQLKLDEAPCLRLSHLSEAQKKAYVIADNKLALNSGWDNDLLRQEVIDLEDQEFEIGLLGFAPHELQALLDTPDFDPTSENDQGKLDQLEPKWVACPHCGKEFDLREQG